MGWQYIFASRWRQATTKIAFVDTPTSAKMPAMPITDAVREAGRGIQRRAEHQRGRRSSQFDRRREGAGGLSFDNAKVRNPRN